MSLHRGCVLVFNSYMTRLLRSLDAEMFYSNLEQLEVKSLLLDLTPPPTPGSPPLPLLRAYGRGGDCSPAKAVGGRAPEGGQGGQQTKVQYLVCFNIKHLLSKFLPSNLIKRR